MTAPLLELRSASDPFAGRLRERIRAGERLVGTFCNLGSAVSARICARAGFDWLLVDLEHGSRSEGELVAHLQAVAAAGGGASALVRVESHERSRFGNALDDGAAGVMAPRVESAEQARLVVTQIESPAAVATAGEIAAVGGADVVFVGPSDLSHALGCFGHLDDSGTLEEGFSFVGISGDGGFLTKAAVAGASQLRDALARA